MDERNQIQQIRQEIFMLAKESSDLETMHWYIALDDCFENDEFQKKEASNLRWRISVLWAKEEPVRFLTDLIEPLLIQCGHVNTRGKWIK